MSLDKIYEAIDKLREVSIKNSIVLEEHIKRTELNEQRIERLEKFLLGLLSAILISIIALALK